MKEQGESPASIGEACAKSVVKMYVGSVVGSGGGAGGVGPVNCVQFARLEPSSQVPSFVETFEVHDKLDASATARSSCQELGRLRR